MKYKGKNVKRFRPRASRCSHCTFHEDDKANALMYYCKKFGWLILKSLGRTQAICKE